jgi:hypothetical protein
MILLIFIFFNQYLLHYSTKTFQPKLMPLFIVRFSKISIALYGEIWFGKFQHDRIKQNKLSTFINRLNYV